MLLDRFLVVTGATSPSQLGGFMAGTISMSALSNRREDQSAAQRVDDTCGCGPSKDPFTSAFLTSAEPSAYAELAPTTIRVEAVRPNPDPDPFALTGRHP